MYDTILVPTDGSSDARRGAEHGVGLAAALGATVHAVYVVEEGTNPWRSEAIEDQLEEAEAYGTDLTDQVAELAAAAGVTSVTETLVGPHVAEELNEYVESEGIDVIVMGSGFRGRLGDLLGSTADRVLRTARVPVTVVRAPETV